MTKDQAAERMNQYWVEGRVSPRPGPGMLDPPP